MANDTEDVKYSFQGDTSSLRKATQDAIAQLNRFEGAIQKVASQDSFKASRTSVQGLQRAVNSLTTQTNALTKVLNTTSVALDKMMPKGAADVVKVTSELAESVRYLESVSGATSADLQLVTSVLKDLGGTMSTVSAQATALGTSLKTTDSVQQQIAQSTNTASTALAAAARSAEPLLRVLPRIQDAYQLSGKSALESARVFASSESIWRRMQVELTNIGNIAANAWSRFTTPLRTVEQKIQSFKDKVKNAFSRIDQWFSPISKALRRTATESEAASKGISKVASAAKAAAGASKILSGVTGLLSKAFTALVGIKVGDWLAGATKQSITYIENLNLFTVAMGDAVDQGKQFVSTMQELYGMDPSNLMRYAGNFYQLATAIEMPDEAATNLSLTMTKAANDIASLFNVNIEKVFEDLSSGMQGMSRAVRKYGMDIRTSTLQTEALALGITEQVENMSEANRIGLRFLTMMKQASNASGDFARNIETPANQLRILKEQMSQLGRAIGNFFIAPLGNAIRYINGFVMALRAALVFIAELLGLVSDSSDSFGTEGADAEAEAIAGVGSAATDAAKKVKKFLAPFDELTILQEKSADSDSGSGSMDLMDPAIADAIANMGVDFEDIRMKANEVRDAILEFLGFEVDMGKIISWDPEPLKNLLNVDGVSGKVDNLVALFGRLEQPALMVKESFSMVLESLMGLLGNMWAGIQNLWNEHIVPMLQQTGEALVPILSTIGVCWSYVAQILASAINTLSTLWTSVLMPVFAAVFDAIGNLMQIVETLWTVVLGPIIEHIAAGIHDLWVTTLQPIFQKIIEIIGGLVEAILALWNNVLAPVLDWLIRIFGPVLRALLVGIWDFILDIVKGIGLSIDTVLVLLKGITDFLAGVFTGDWTRAWKSIVNTFIGLANKIIDAAELLVNMIIGLVNNMISIVFNAVVALINSITKAVSGIAKVFGYDISLELSAKPPKIPKQYGGRIPALAQGAVVTSPTIAMIGEGKYDEAVIPLGDSPQMKELVDKIVGAISQERRDERPVNVHVYVDGREITTSQNNNNRMYGRVQQNS